MMGAAGPRRDYRGGYRRVTGEVLGNGDGNAALSWRHRLPTARMRGSVQIDSAELEAGLSE